MSQECTRCRAVEQQLVQLRGQVGSTVRFVDSELGDEPTMAPRRALQIVQTRLELALETR